MAEELNHLILINYLENYEERDPRWYRVRERNPFELTDKQFIKLFRLSKDLVRFLINIISDHIQPAQRATDLDISTKVLIFLRFVASGSYQMDIGCNFNFCVSQSSVSRCIEEVVNAINRQDVIGRFVKFPTNIEDLNNLRTEFYREFNFPGIIGCIDCTHVAIYPPKINDQLYPEHIYVNRKNYHSINVQLICDHRLRILNVNALYPGSTNDAYIWGRSNVQDFLERLHERENPSHYYLLGDSGYPLRTWLLTPLEREPEPNTPEHFYNRRHKTIRSLIERCNGLLKMRFRCLLKHRTLHYSPEKATKIINACVVLHNLCVEHNMPEPEEDEEDLVNLDFGIYPPVPNGIENEEAVRRVNPELLAGRRLRQIVIRNLRQ